MRILAAACLSLLPLAGVAAGTTADALLQSLDRCLARLETVAEEEANAALCPDAVRAIEDSAWVVTLPVAAGELSAIELEELRGLTLPYASARQSGPAPDPAALDRILAELEPERVERRLGIWQRLGRWIRDRLGGWLETPEFVKRLGGWLRPYGESAGAVLGWTLLAGAAAVLAAALAFTLRAMAQRRRERRAPRAWRRALSPEPGALDVTTALAGLVRLPPATAVRRLLEIVVVALHERGLLASYRGLTPREVAAAAELSDEQRAVVERVARGAERSTFGLWQPPGADAAALIDLAGALLAGLPRAGKMPR